MVHGMKTSTVVFDGFYKRRLGRRALHKMERLVVYCCTANWTRIDLQASIGCKRSNKKIVEGGIVERVRESYCCCSSF